jgi:hypothetical protein
MQRRYPANRITEKERQCRYADYIGLMIKKASFAAANMTRKKK